ncbi:helix-turn-helix transcriptional regulator [Streptomyces sp. NPDC021225]|uniref:helix-turn-helix transcriptional regulator n=1 Tax=Streptomyces sp. NPDC021225 TaxID=3365121 RepID=UPI0037949248
MRSERLLALLLLLQTHGQTSARELAERLEVSVRTVMRDIEALSAAGVPVYTERGPHGGIALVPGYRTDVSGLTADETRALFVLLSDSAHADLGLGQAMGSALRKIMAVLPEVHRPEADLASRRVLIEPDRWHTGATPAPVPGLACLQDAVFGDQRLRVRYRHGRDGSERSYTLDAYGLVNKAGVWYLVADHQTRPKLFRADRVVTASVLSEQARLRPGVELQHVWRDLRREVENVERPVKVTVRVAPDTLARFLRVHHTELAAPAGTHSRPDTEATELTLQFRSLGHATTLLSFGPKVEVVDPPELQDALRATAQATAALYPPTAPATLARPPDGS